MRKQASAIILSVILLGISMPTLLTVNAQMHDIDGEDLGYNESISSGVKPWYCECNHDVWMGDPDDSEAGLGLQAQYCLVGYPQNPMFNWAEWWFEGEYGDGGYVSMCSSILIDPCVNGNDHHYYNYYGTLQYGPPPWDPPPDYDCYYIYYDLPASMDPCYSVEGKTIAAFYETGNPWVSWSIEALTQNPPSDPYGYGWSYLSAHW